MAVGITSATNHYQKLHQQQNSSTSTNDYPLTKVLDPNGRVPYKCPVCEGRGNLPVGFYVPYSNGSSTTAAIESCRSCQGQGVIYS